MGEDLVVDDQESSFNLQRHYRLSLPTWICVAGTIPFVCFFLTPLFLGGGEGVSINFLFQHKKLLQT